MAQNKPDCSQQNNFAREVANIQGSQIKGFYSNACLTI